MIHVACISSLYRKIEYIRVVGYNADRIGNEWWSVPTARVNTGVNAELYIYIYIGGWLTPRSRSSSKRSFALLTYFHRADTQTLLFHLTMWRRVLPRPELSARSSPVYHPIAILFVFPIPDAFEHAIPNRIFYSSRKV